MFTVVNDTVTSFAVLDKVLSEALPELSIVSSAEPAMPGAASTSEPDTPVSNPVSLIRIIPLSS